MEAKEPAGAGAYDGYILIPSLHVPPGGRGEGMGCATHAHA